MAMWSPWRGCKKCSDGCLYCYIHNVSRDADELTFCARLLSARKHPVGMYFIGEDIFTLASYYQRDLRDRHFFPSEDWQSLPSDDDDLPTAPQSTIGGLLE